MAEAFRYEATVNAQGDIVLHNVPLAPGTRVQVTVITQPAEDSQNKSDHLLNALRALQASMNLDLAAAERWAAETRKLRGK